MKLAISADLHLTSRTKHPERFAALEHLLAEMVRLDISHLILAGDAFNESGRNYAEFEQICRRPEYARLKVIILPGNHDWDLDRSAFTAANVEVVGAPHVRTFSENGLKFLFLPYDKEKTMGEEIAAHEVSLPANRWILVGHGDWIEGLQERNPLEPGVYMPFTRMDLERFKPLLVLLGHVHKPVDGERICYPGSPCGLDIRETGRRRFLILDDTSGALQSHALVSEVIYFNESFLVLPVDDEIEYLTQQIHERLAGWQVQPAEKERVRVQVKVVGYTKNKRAVQEAVLQAFKDFRFYKDGEPDLSEVYVADDAARAEVVRRVTERVRRIKLESHYGTPTQEEILLKALHVIYGD